MKLIKYHNPKTYGNWPTASLFDSPWREMAAFDSLFEDLLRGSGKTKSIRRQSLKKKVVTMS